MFDYLVVFIILQIFLDISYVLRTLFTIVSGRLYQGKYSVTDVTSVYGIGTWLDCDVKFRHIREARILRDLDIARFHFYDRTGIYHRTFEYGISFLQGCTFVLCQEPIPLFSLYRITTKLVYWDDRSLFLEHKVITIGDGKVRYYLISRQHAVSDSGHSALCLLKGLPGAERKFECPENIQKWLQSMQVTSEKLRGLR